MSDAPTSTPRQPSSVERMSNSKSSSSTGAGMGGAMTWLLAVACLALIVACFYIASGKRELQAKLDQTTNDLNDAKSALNTANGNIQTKERDITTLRAELDRRIPVYRLPASIQATNGNVNDTIANIVKLAEGGSTTTASGNTTTTRAGSPTGPAADSPTAWMETIARQVAKGSIKTNEPVGNDAGKVQMHKGIQIVMAKVGSFNKQPTGNPKDTYDAVIAFQKANGLTADGIIGKGTWGKVREKMEATAHVPQ